jgi:hypothetical protein
MTELRAKDWWLGRVRVTLFKRGPTCDKRTAFHVWGNGGFVSFFLAIKPNPIGLQPCGCYIDARLKRRGKQATL